MIKQAIDTMSKGLRINNYKLYTKQVLKGRFCEEVNIDLWLRKDNADVHLMFLKVFYGRPPHYKPWVEFFNINEHVRIENTAIDYFDSLLENTLLQLFAQHIEPGENMFVEYNNDRETKKQLEVGFPEPVSRLGYKLFKLGFTWFKDWYFPEGFMEGDQKLQAEKPLDETQKARHLESIAHHVQAFLKRINEKNSEWYVKGALERARNILRTLSVEKNEDLISRVFLL